MGMGRRDTGYPMHARVLTLRYSTEAGAFDDCELQQLTTSVRLVVLEPHGTMAEGCEIHADPKA